MVGASGVCVGKEQHPKSIQHPVFLSRLPPQHQQGLATLTPEIGRLQWYFPWYGHLHQPWADVGSTALGHTLVSCGTCIVPPTTPKLCNRHRTCAGQVLTRVLKHEENSTPLPLSRWGALPPHRRQITLSLTWRETSDPTPMGEGGGGGGRQRQAPAKPRDALERRRGGV